MAKTASRLTRIMRTLRPGDVITNLDCPKHRHHRILVLASRGGTKFDFSMKASNDLNIIRDPNGPYHWNDVEQTFENDSGDDYGHVGADTVVLQGAGLEEVEWYRSLPPAQSDRFFINPKNLTGTKVDPGTLAKIEALLNRVGDEDDDGAQQVRNVSHALELIFAGTGALDARRASLMQLLINASVYAAQESLKREEQLRGLHDFFETLVSGGEMFSQGQQRSERPRSRANGHGG